MIQEKTHCTNCIILLKQLHNDSTKNIDLELKQKENLEIIDRLQFENASLKQHILLDEKIIKNERIAQEKEKYIFQEEKCKLKTQIECLKDTIQKMKEDKIILIKDYISFKEERKDEYIKIKKKLIELAQEREHFDQILSNQSEKYNNSLKLIKIQQQQIYDSLLLKQKTKHQNQLKQNESFYLNIQKKLRDQIEDISFQLHSSSSLNQSPIPKYTLFEKYNSASPQTSEIFLSPISKQNPNETINSSIAIVTPLSFNLPSKIEKEARLKTKEEKINKYLEESTEEESRIKAEEGVRIRNKEETILNNNEETSIKTEEETRIKVKAENEAIIKVEEEAKAKYEVESRKEKKDETQKKLKEEESRIKEEEEAKIKAEEDVKAKAEEEARIKAEEDARLKAEEDAKAKAEEEARIKAEEEAKAKAEEEARIKAEEEAKAKAEEDARIKAEEEAKAKAEEDARIKAEEDARIKAEEDARIKAEEDARIKAEEDARIKAEEDARVKKEARIKAEEDARLKEEEDKAKIEIESRKETENETQNEEDFFEARFLAEEESKLKEEEEARIKAEEEFILLRQATIVSRIKAEEEAKAKAEEEAKAKAEEDARIKAEEEAKAKAEEDARIKAEEEAKAKAKAEEDARIKAEEEAKAKAEAEEEARIKAEEDVRLKEEEDARIKAEEDAKAKAEEDARLKKEARIKAEEDARLKEEEDKAKIEIESRKETENETGNETQNEEDFFEARFLAEEESKLKEEEEARIKAEEEFILLRQATIVSRIKAEEDAKAKTEIEEEAILIQSSEKNQNLTKKIERQLSVTDEEDRYSFFLQKAEEETRFKEETKLKAKEEIINQSKENQILKKHLERQLSVTNGIYSSSSDSQIISLLSIPSLYRSFGSCLWQALSDILMDDIPSIKKHDSHIQRKSINENFKKPLYPDQSSVIDTLRSSYFISSPHINIQSNTHPFSNSVSQFLHQNQSTNNKNLKITLERQLSITNGIYSSSPDSQINSLISIPSLYRSFGSCLWQALSDILMDDKPFFQDKTDLSYSHQLYHKSASTIQRVYRGYRERLSIFNKYISENSNLLLSPSSSMKSNTTDVTVIQCENTNEEQSETLETDEKEESISPFSNFLKEYNVKLLNSTDLKNQIPDNYDIDDFSLLETESDFLAEQISKQAHIELDDSFSSDFFQESPQLGFIDKIIESENEYELPPL